MLSRARLDPNDAAQREIIGAPIADRDLRRPIRTNADRDLTGRSASLEQNDVVEASRDNILIGEAACRADAQLPMSKASVESDADVGRFTGAIFDRQRIHGTGRVRVASVWGEDRSAHNDTPDRAGERRDPPECALPGHLRAGKVPRALTNANRRFEQRHACATQKISRRREFDGRA